MWGVATFDSGLGLYVRPSVLRKAGVRMPKGVDDAWTADELTEILRKLRAEGYEAPLDLNFTDSKAADEWNTYAFAPAVWSAGGDLIDPRGVPHGRRVPQQPGDRRGPHHHAELGQEVCRPGPEEDKAVHGSRSPISWMGHWKYGEFSEAFTGDVKIGARCAFRPFGRRTVTGNGLLAGGVPPAADGDRRRRFLAHLLKPARRPGMSRANGAIPATDSAVDSPRGSPRAVPSACSSSSSGLVLDSAQYAVALISDLLDLSRLDEDRLKPVIRAVEPVSIANRAIAHVTPAANLKQVALQLAPSPDLPTCETDASRVEQILVNLLGNAIKYAPERSTVRASITSRERRIVYQIEDEGPGVPASEVERIFDIYVTKAGEEGRGLGLGLPLSRRLAQLLGGELHAVTRPGKGGCFILEVPASAS